MLLPSLVPNWESLLTSHVVPAVKGLAHGLPNYLPHFTDGMQFFNQFDGGLALGGSLAGVIAVALVGQMVVVIVKSDVGQLLLRKHPIASDLIGFAIMAAGAVAILGIL
jgi:prolipoprotein diacylglyceryltransferase